MRQQTPESFSLCNACIKESLSSWDEEPVIAFLLKLRLSAAKRAAEDYLRNCVKH